MVAIALIVALALSPAAVGQEDSSAETAPVEVDDYRFRDTDPASFGVVAPSREPLKVAYEDWARSWFDWFLLSPVEQNPIAQGGCDLGDQGDVFFLPAAPPGTTVAIACTVRDDQYILVSPGGVIAWAVGHDKPRKKVQAESVDASTVVFDPTLAVDGATIPVGGSYWIRIDAYESTAADGNVLDIPAGPFFVAGSGWWLMLEPLEAGEHTIFSGNSRYGPGGKIETSRQTVTVTVVEPT